MVSLSCWFMEWSSCSAVPVGPVETVGSKGVLWLVVILQSGVTPRPGQTEHQHLKEAGKNALANLASALGSAPYLVSLFYTVLTVGTGIRQSSSFFPYFMLGTDKIKLIPSLTEQSDCIAHA